MDRRIRIIGVISIIVLIILEQALNMSSFVKQGYKMIFLVLIPLLVIYFYKKSNFIDEYNIKKVKLVDLKIPFYFGVFIFFLGIVGYLILKPIVSEDTLVGGLQDRGITLQNIYLSVLYLSFINSFIEEFFFRGFIYQSFRSINETTGYIVSSLLFSIYHVLVMFAIFDVLMGFLALFGLTVVGLALVWINRTNKSIINSWIVHIFADLGVCSIGIYWFIMMGT